MRVSAGLPGVVPGMLPGVPERGPEHHLLSATPMSTAVSELDNAKAVREDGLVEGEDGVLFPKEEQVPTVKETLGSIFELAVPMVICLILILVNEVVNTIVIGRAGSGEQLAAVGIANMMQNCCGLSIGLGLAGALDTFVSQAYGAGEYEVMHRSLHRCRIVMTMTLVVIIPVLWFSEPILLFLRQDAAIAAYAGQYNKVTSFGLFAFFQKDALGKFMMNQNNPWPPTAVAFFTSILHVGWAVLFVCYLDLGNMGIGLANVVTWYLQFFALSVWVAHEAGGMGFTKREVLWGDWPSWDELQEYLKVAIPAVVALCSEWWVWEICALLVGYLGPVELAAHVSTINFNAMLSMTSLGYTIAITTLFGNAIGANQPRTARKTLLVSICVIMANWFALAVPTVFGSNFVAKAYSSDPEVQRTMQPLLRLLTVAWCFDSFQNALGGALRAAGMQDFVATAFLIAYYCVMLPLGSFLAFRFGYGVLGFWLSFSSGTFVAAAILTAKTFTIDIAKVAADAAAEFANADKTEKDDECPTGTTMI